MRVSLNIPPWGFPVGALVNNPPVSAGDARDQVPSLGQKDLLQSEMATCSSTLAWRIPWTGEPGGLQSMGSQRVGHNRVSTHTEYMHLISRQTALKCDHTISFFLKQPSSFLGMLPSFMEPQEKRRFGSKYYFGKGICSRCCGHLTHVPSLSTSVNARANSPLPRPALFFA